MTAMKFLKHIRSKSKVKERDGEKNRAQSQSQGYAPQYAPCYGRDSTARLPSAVLHRIFIEVCPLTGDDSYDSSEESLIDYGCALCDLKDLAQCALVSRKWWNVAEDLLYGIPSQPAWIWLTVCFVQISEYSHRAGALLRARI